MSILGKPGLLGLLVKTPIVTKISFSNSNIRFIEPSTFEQFCHLEELDLSSNILCYLDPLTLVGLSQLVKLRLSNNKLEALHPPVFEHLPMLREIHADSNQIERFSENTFRECSRLCHLNLASNKLRSLHALSFTRTRELTSLNLGSNKLIYIHPQLFVDCRALRELWLDSNLIYELGVSTFINCSNLVFLSLASNKIKFIDPDLFSKCANLETLHLQGNRFNKVMLFPGSLSLVNVQINVERITRISYTPQDGVHDDLTLVVDTENYRFIDRWKDSRTLFEFYHQSGQIKSMITYLQKTGTLANALQQLISQGQNSLLDQVLSVNSLFQIFDLNQCRNDHGVSLLNYAIAHGYIDSAFILCAFRADLTHEDVCAALDASFEIPAERRETRADVVQLLLKFVPSDEHGALSETILSTLDDGAELMPDRTIRNLVFQGESAVQVSLSVLRLLTRV